MVPHAGNEIGKLPREKAAKLQDSADSMLDQHGK